MSPNNVQPQFLSLRLLTTYLYLLRVPILLAIALGAIGPLTLPRKAPLRNLLEGFFDVYDPGTPIASLIAVVIIGAFVFLFVVAATTVSDLVIRYGYLRFDIPKLPFPDRRLPFKIRVSAATRWLFFFYFAAGLSMVISLVWYLRDHWLPVAGAVLLALVTVGAAVGLIATIWKRTPASFSGPFARFFRWSPEGFLTDDENYLRAGHGFALLMLAFALIVFLVFALGRIHPPTAGSAVFILLLLCWLLAGIAFTVDRFRIPLLVTLAAVWIYAARFPESDHYYDARHEKESATRLDAATVLSKDNQPIVVAAAGGGIQAAAWTAEVLNGLIRADKTGKFAPAVRIVSGVSGGAVGALYFVAAYDNGTIPVDMLDELVLKPAQRSSLEAVGWGLAYPDFARSILPLRWYQEIDRGQEMEEAWAQGLPAVEAPLRTWQRDALMGRRPAVIFNATVVETGQRFMISTVDPPENGSSVGRQTFSKLYPQHDLKAVTAARLSSTFPYVTPVARINYWVEKSRRVHIADGGYYDNFGITSVAELLDDATRRKPGEGAASEILLIEISGSDPESETTCDDYFDRKQTPADEQGGGSRGWFYQVFAPLQGLYNVRDAGQRSRNEQQLLLLTEALAARNVRLSRARFLFPCTGTPLSWHLTARQKRRIAEAWRLYDGAEKDKVLGYLSADNIAVEGR